VNDTLKEALARLPQAIKDRADSLFEAHGEDAAKVYLKQQILLQNPGCKFAKPIPNPKAEPRVTDHTLVTGSKVSFGVSGKIIPGVKTTDGEVLVSRARLCEAFGWDQKRLTRIPAKSPKAQRLTAHGYTFEEFKLVVRGKPQNPTYISLPDAKAAVEVFGVTIRGVSNAA
jgi:hypothetical protein